MADPSDVDSDTTIDPDRIQTLNDRPVVQGRFVLYWMQQSQRADWNHALELAVGEANRLAQGVVVLFCLMDHYRGIHQGRDRRPHPAAKNS